MLNSAAKVQKKCRIERKKREKTTNPMIFRDVGRELAR
jgi:hypothetical protein